MNLDPRIFANYNLFESLSLPYFISVITKFVKLCKEVNEKMVTITKNDISAVKEILACVLIIVGIIVLINLNTLISNLIPRI